MRSRLDQDTPTALLWQRIDAGFDPTADPSPIQPASTQGGGDGTVPAWAAWHAHASEANRVELAVARRDADLAEHREVLAIVQGLVEQDRIPAPAEQRSTPCAGSTMLGCDANGAITRGAGSKEDGMIHVETHGARIPALGLGTFRLDGSVAQRMVSHALEIGYRHIDTAQMYGNESEVGAAIASAGVPRDDIWLTTKIWPDNFRDGALQRAAETSVRRLRTEPDLLLLHWPNPNVPLAETIRALNDARRRGLARHIGISNFTVALIKEALPLSEEPLIVNQVEYQPFLSQNAALEELRTHGMALIAYSPLAQGRVFGDETLARIGQRHDKNPGQVTLRWLIQQDGVTAIPRSSREAHAKANFEIFDFALSDAEMAEISALAHPGGRQVNPAGFAPRWD